MGAPIISFDEAGNTGQNLLDINQPVFVLASVSLTDAEAAQVIGKVNGTELHFKQACNSARGRAHVMRVLNGLDLSRVRVAVAHKPFMLTAKIVDELVEWVLHDAGINTTADDMLPQLAHLWHYTFDPIFGHGTLATLHRHFITAVRGADHVAADNFYELVDDLIQRDPNVPGLDALAVSRPHMDDILNGWELAPLEPGIPTAYALMQAWAADFPSGFDVRHDERRELRRFADILAPLRNRTTPPVSIPLPDGRSVTLPLPIDNFTMVRSHDHPAIQVADIVAGAVALQLAPLAGGRTDPFNTQLASIPIRDRVLTAVWPTTPTPTR